MYCIINLIFQNKYNVINVFPKVISYEKGKSIYSNSYMIKKTIKQLITTQNFTKYKNVPKYSSIFNIYKIYVKF